MVLLVQDHQANRIFELAGPAVSGGSGKGFNVPRNHDPQCSVISLLSQIVFLSSSVAFLE